MDLRELLLERAKLHEENKAALDLAGKEKRTLNTEEQSAYDKRSARMSEIKATVDRVEQNAADERELAQSRGRRTDSVISDPSALSDADRDLAFRAWALGSHATPEMMEAAQRCGVNVRQPYIDMAQRVRRGENGEEIRTFLPVTHLTNSHGEIQARALSIGTTTAGGNSVPNEVMRAYLEQYKWFGRVREDALVIQTETGATLPWPSVTDTANTGRQLAEGTAATTITDPTFNVTNLSAYKFSSDAVVVSWELLQDSFIDLSGYLGMALGRRVARKQNTLYTTGTGTGEPKGIVAGAGTGKTAASTTAFTADELIDLVHSLDIAYRTMPDVKFWVHDTIASYIRKFKDGNGRYLWEMSTQVGQPDRLFGYPVSINNDMDSALTTGKKLVLFGSAKQGFIVREAGAVRFVRSDEKYILEHQVMFEASQRTDSNVVDALALKLLVLA